MTFWKSSREGDLTLPEAFGSLLRALNSFMVVEVPWY
jgi:hypothetical protein